MQRRAWSDVAADMFLYMLPVYVPFYQALLVHGICQAIILLVLAVLLMFLVAHRVDLCRAVTAFLKTLPSSWLAPARHFGLRELSFAAATLPNAPRLSPLFQRPPPLFA